MQLEDHETEKTNFLRHIDSLTEKSQNLESKVRNLELYIDGLENEKSNLLFELNELKAAGDSAATSSVDSNERIQDLEDQLHIANRDNQELLAELKAAHVQVSEASSMVANLKAQVDEREVMNKSHEKEIEKLREHVRNLQRDLKATVDDFLDQRDRLQVEMQAELQKIRDDDVENANKTATTQEAVTGLQQQLNEKCRVEEKLTAECERLKLSIAALEKEKAELVASIAVMGDEFSQEKFKLAAQIQQGEVELVSVKAELENLTRLLKAEAEKSYSFAVRVDELERMDSQRQSQEREAMQTELYYLREKVEILTASVQTEQNNVKTIQKEKIDLVEKNTSLAKDLDRLRQHLLEIEEAHTQESMELQKSIDESKARMAHMEDQVKQSSTAYTSAK